MSERADLIKRIGLLRGSSVLLIHPFYGGCGDSQEGNEMPKTINKTGTQHLLIVLDRSGSMSSCRSDVIGGTNQFIQDQKQLKDQEVKATLVIFDDVVEHLCEQVPLEDVPELTEGNYVPRGSTALLDAIGKTIHAAAPKVKKKDRVLMAIFTDGFENASREYTNVSVKALIEEKEQKDGNWTIAYLGANQDAWAIAGQLGIAFGNTQSYDSVNTAAAMHSHSVSTLSYRGSDVTRTSNLFNKK